MENTTPQAMTTTTGNEVELTGKPELLTAAQRNRIDWLDAELADGVIEAYTFGADNGVGVPAGNTYVHTGGHPEGRLVIEVNPLGGMTVDGSSADLLAELINQAPSI